VPNGDNIFPVRKLAQFFQPAPITCGYSESTLISLDGPASAQVVIQLSSDNPAQVSVPATVTVLTGAISASITIKTAALPTPFAPYSVNVHASSAGTTPPVPVQVVAPAAASVSLAPDTVTCGDSSTATVSLDYPSLLGSVVVDLNSSAPGFATVPPQITI